MVLEGFRKLSNHHVFLLKLRLELLYSHFEILLVNGMRGTLLHELLCDASKSLALVVICLNLFLELLGLSAFDVLAEDL